MKNNDWSSLIELLASKYQTNQEKIMESLKFAIEKAYLKEFPDVHIQIDIKPDKKAIELFELRKVVKDYPEIDDDQEISLEDAIKENPELKLNDVCKKAIAFSQFERRMAAHVKQIFDQKMVEVANFLIYEKWRNHIGTIIRAEVEENKERYIEINLGASIKGVVTKADQIKNEILEMNKKYFFYIKDVKESTKGWPIILSRTHPGLIENLLQEFVSEIKNKQIEIKAIARVAGFKTKIAVQSNQFGIDPIGTCVGVGGERIKSISKEINNEFVDFIRWDDDLKQLIVNACLPHKLIGVEINDDIDNPSSNHKLISLVLDNENIPKLIGRDGANLKLISKITNCTIEGIFNLEDAIESKINYFDLTDLYSKNNFSKSSFKNYQASLITDEDLNGYEYSTSIKEKPISKPVKTFKPRKQVQDFEDFEEIIDNVKTFDNEIDDQAFDDIIENISVPKKSKVIEKNLHVNIDNLLIDEDNHQSKIHGPKYRKTKNLKKSKKEEESIFKDEVDDFQDITEDSINYESEINFSDNLEIDEEEE